MNITIPKEMKKKVLYKKVFSEMMSWDMKEKKEDLVLEE
jgi:hypothetical protein